MRKRQTATNLTVVRNEPAEPETPAAEPMPVDEATEPPTVPMQEVLVRVIFNLDGTPVFNAPFTVYVPHPDAVPAEQRAEVNLGIDGRQVAQLLEQHLGPSSASVPRPGLYRGPNAQPLILPASARSRSTRD